MNEITRIHLGRQPFTASVEAHKVLKAYLAAIALHVQDKDVVQEIELRMAELLTERGITGDKVILDDDVAYLKQQLGDPKDFSESGDEVDTQSEDRQLFRDPENGMVAGVAAGLAAYFGIDALLFRIVFVIGTFTGGWGLLLYIIFWLLVPPVKTGSDRLRMRGASVTLGNLKDIVERADAPGAAKRAGKTIAPLINTVFQIVLKIIGIVFIIASLSVLFALVATRIYMALHNGQLFQEGLFPVGRTERILADLGFGLIGLLAIFSITCGLAIYKRRWPLPGWVTGVLIGVFFIGLAVAAPLSINSVHEVHDRYESQLHNTIRSLKPFTQLNFVGGDIDDNWDYEYASTYSVRFQYLGNPDISKIKTTVHNNLLQIDSSNYQANRNCTMLCMFPQYHLRITVYGPRPLAPSSPTRPSLSDTSTTHVTSEL